MIPGTLIFFILITLFSPQLLISAENKLVNNPQTKIPRKKASPSTIPSSTPAQEKLKEELWKQLPDDTCKKIIYDHFIDSISPQDSIETIAAYFDVMRTVDKRMRKITDDPATMRTIIANLSGNKDQNIIAKELSEYLPRARSYHDNSNSLHRYAYCMGQNKMGNLVKRGADANYFPSQKRPVLFAAGLNKNKLKCLLDNGANVDVIFNEKTILGKAIESKKYPIVQLLLSYNPKDKYLSAAILTKDNAIIKLILASPNIPVEQLNKGLFIAIHSYNEEVTSLLLDAGADVNMHLHSAAQLYGKLMWGGENEQTKALHNIIISLCQRGAWNPRTYERCKKLCSDLVNTLLLGLFNLSRKQNNPTAFYNEQLEKSRKL